MPKYLVNEDGALGARNDLRCVSIEHKLGIHASPTCVMSNGDAGGAVGYPIGEANQGMRYMFTTMNNARLSVGVQGLAIAERAYQDALRPLRKGRRNQATLSAMLPSARCARSSSPVQPGHLVAARLVDRQRWCCVPFCLRTGKRQAASTGNPVSRWRCRTGARRHR